MTMNSGTTRKTHVVSILLPMLLVIHMYMYLTVSDDPYMFFFPLRTLLLCYTYWLLVVFSNGQCDMQTADCKQGVKCNLQTVNLFY